MCVTSCGNTIYTRRVHHTGVVLPAVIFFHGGVPRGPPTTERGIGPFHKSVLSCHMFEFQRLTGVITDRHNREYLEIIDEFVCSLGTECKEVIFIGVSLGTIYARRIQKIYDRVGRMVEIAPAPLDVKTLISPVEGIYNTEWVDLIKLDATLNITGTNTTDAFWLEFMEALATQRPDSPPTVPTYIVAFQSDVVLQSTYVQKDFLPSPSETVPGIYTILHMVPGWHEQTLGKTAYLAAGWWLRLEQHALGTIPAGRHVACSAQATYLPNLFQYLLLPWTAPALPQGVSIGNDGNVRLQSHAPHVPLVNVTFRVQANMILASVLRAVSSTTPWVQAVSHALTRLELATIPIAILPDISYRVVVAPKTHELHGMPTLSVKSQCSTGHTAMYVVLLLLVPVGSLFARILSVSTLITKGNDHSVFSTWILPMKLYRGDQLLLVTTRVDHRYTPTIGLQSCSSSCLSPLVHYRL